ncbi:pimeloyl-ACP methyl ester carboxylesterase [Streptosporangium becharense]|uniref:Pimeloyl-ACP methyl ester carboxylesterase n=1 Tax=Streptosporangium becharense TaxID=1816182 RepID=A0A7W9MER0_9ACTN|nr:alpha/beta hydrolase [Streptosporangium becharense]MBB2915417.1 pimeloyl-ACP methyl ester carboxylesterase [Streptosporangium becharense]MBB5817604.1 pimeloyl-ACP methyl ester carboxylesterase [Streptosporangium becharense]
MSTYVLVPGFWLGAWAWEKVTRPLRAAGHDVHPVTLTGLGDRVHLAGPRVDLETHIQDIVHTVVYADLREVILVAHSGAGAPVTGAADRIPERVARIVYLDSGPLADGMTQLDAGEPEWNAFVAERVAERGDGIGYPLISWEEQERAGASLEGLDAAAREWFASRATPQPYAAMTQPLKLTGAVDALPKTLVSCSFPLERVHAMIAAGHPFFAALAGPEWSFAELPTGHWPMFSEPDKTAAVLGALAG